MALTSVQANRLMQLL